MENNITSEYQGIINNSMFHFVRDSLRQSSFPYIIWLFFAMILSLCAYTISRSGIASPVGPGILVYYTIMLSHVVFRLNSGGKSNIMSPDIIFLLLFTLFHHGYTTLYALNIVPYSNYIFHFDSSIAKAMLIVNMSLIGFLFGFELAGIGNASHTGPIICKIPTRSWCVFGIILMMTSLIMHFAGLTLIGPSRIIESGYSAFNADYLESVWPASMLLNRSIYVMVLGLVIYSVSSALRYGKLFKSKFALGMTAAFIILVALERDRGPILKFCAPLFMVRHYFIKRIKIRYLVLLFIGMMFIFAAIAAVRTIALNPGRMLEEYKAKKSVGEIKWENSFVEMGGSFMIVNIVAHEVPNTVPYWKGSTWAAGAAHIVPFFYGFLYNQGWIRVTPSEWITYVYFGRDAGGKAFTVAAEGYLNFGLIGAFFETMLCGLFIRWLTIKFSKNPSAMWAFITLGCLAAMLQIIRNEAYIVTDVCMIIFVFAWLVNTVFSNEYKIEIFKSEGLV